MANPKRHPSPVNWREALVAELRGPEIPADAVCCYDFGTGESARQRAAAVLKSKEAAGELVSAIGVKDGAPNNRRARWYWPAG